MTISEIIKNALTEDIGDGDHSSLASIDANAISKARLYVKEDGILAGIDVAKEVFAIFDSNLKMDVFISDGTAVKVGDVAFEVTGPAISILSTERTVLNFMQRMSGIATSTHKLAKLIADTQCKILDTRKTTPGVRIFEKMAVKIGGGENHRMGLYDMIMLKDNHIDYAGGIRDAIEKTQVYLAKKQKNLKIEIEARTLEDVKEIIQVGGVDRIMLDNFAPEKISEALLLINGKYETEASGKITHENIREYALTGVDFISSGALTHHIKSLDLSLKAVI
jgi:nicotinate-nucleotide pyrophosphorylase (carboxylating)